VTVIISNAYLKR